MQCSESRKEAARLTPLLTPRTTARVATWNIGTMYETGKNHPSSERDEKLQDRSAGTEWDKVATVRTAEAFIQRAAAVLRTQRGWSPLPLPTPILRVWP